MDFYSILHRRDKILNEKFAKSLEDIKTIVVNSGLDLTDQRSLLYTALEQLRDQYVDQGKDFSSEARIISHSVNMTGKMPSDLGKKK